MRFKDVLKEKDLYPLKAEGLDILQVNLGYKCNMACKHCHVEAGPARTEFMDRTIIDEVVHAINRGSVKTIDITGGAPELNPHFRYLIERSKEAGKHVVVRSNLTIFYENGMTDLPELYQKCDVEVIASLPYYMETTVDRVRGEGTFSKSINALRALNELGYGNDSGLNLNLVYNPQGAFLPSSQSSLEVEYKRELKEKYDIVFNNLYTFTNMPIGRFRNFLEKSGNLDKYLTILTTSFNPETLQGIMCRYLISVGWDGTLYDCDFNQVTGLKVVDGYPQHIAEFDPGEIANREIAIDDHCFGCTAGQGST